MLSQCTATKNNGKQCTIPATYPYTLCHVHNPEGKFQRKLRGENIHEHRYYMRDPGIMCIDCGDIWQSENTNS
jgi:hypothetical protein